MRRNKLKRRLRELTRQRVLPQAGSWDLLVRDAAMRTTLRSNKLREEIDSVASQLR